MIALAIALLSPAPEPATDPPPATPDPPAAIAAPQASVWRHGLHGAMIVNPLGLFVRYDATRPMGGGLKLGLFSNWQVYGNGFGAQIGYETDPLWFETHLDLSTEPGWYNQLPGDARIGAGIDPGTDAIDRRFGWRHNATWQTNVNIRQAGWWIYSRTTAVLRLRDFIEADTFSQMQVRTELSIEEAAALGYSLWQAGDRQFWIYAEHTIGGVWNVGVRPNRPSLGLILENVPDGTVFNLDVFYSFAPGTLAGLGAIGAWWVKF